MRVSNLDKQWVLIEKNVCSITRMSYFTDAIKIIAFIVVAIGGGLGTWGGINLFEGYGSDNPGSKSQGIKQLCAGAGIAIIGTVLIPKLATLFTYTPTP